MDSRIARMLDANANRAREALRVMEDHARFVLDDAGLCGEMKTLRHDLARAMREAGLDRALAVRDTPGDVGTTLSTEAERTRATTGDVVRAAAKRLSEALRVLEEYGKIALPAFAEQVEQLRYRGYELERRHVGIVEARARFGRVRLYVLVTEALCRRPWLEVIRAAAAGGADCFQLREKEFDDRALLARGRAFVALCHELGALAIINDRADVAVACGADGVHVGQDDIDVAAARRVVGPEGLVGVSTHTATQAAHAAAQGPDYVAVGPMFGTPLKPEHPIAGPHVFREVRKATSLPLVAIGGIDADNVRVLAEAGATCAAVCSAVISSPDPEVAARQIAAGLPPVAGAD